MIQKVPIIIGLSVIFTTPVVMILSVVYERSLNGTEISFISLAAFLFFVGIMLIAYALYVQAYINRYYYDSNDSFITIKKGVFAPTEIHVQYQKIQDVYVDQDILDRLLGIFDVHIASATYSSGIEAHIDGVSPRTAEELKHVILARIQGGNNTPGAVSQVPPVQAPAKQAVITGDISSRTFPIGSRWNILQTILSFWGALILTVAVMYLLAENMAAEFIGIEMIWGSTLSYGSYFTSGFLFFIAVFALMVIRWMIWKSNFHFELTPQFLLQKTGIVAGEEKHLPYKSIQNVLIRQSFLEKVLGLSTVVVENASQGGMVQKEYINVNGGVTIPGQSLEQGKKLVQQFNAILATVNSASTGL